MRYEIVELENKRNNNSAQTQTVGVLGCASGFLCISGFGCASGVGCGDPNGACNGNFSCPTVDFKCDTGGVGCGGSGGGIR